MKTINEILRAAKEAGLVVRRSRAKVNGRTAYLVEGHCGLYTKSGLVALIYSDEATW